MPDYVKAVDQRWQHTNNGGLIGIGTKEELAVSIQMYKVETGAVDEDIIYTPATYQEYAKEREDCGLPPLN